MKNMKTDYGLHLNGSCRLNGFQRESLCEQISSSPSYLENVKNRPLELRFSVGITERAPDRSAAFVVIS